MRMMRSLAAAIGLSLAPLPALAQLSILPEVSGEMTAGGGWQSNTSAYFGRYNGQPDHGLYGIGDINVDMRQPWDSGGTNYFHLDANNLGFQTRSANIDFGQQGLWGIQIYYQGIPYWQSSTFKSIWNSDGTLTVPPGSVKNATTINPGALSSFGVNTQRDIVGGNGTFYWRDWTFTSSLRHEHKHGWQETGLMYGSSPPGVTTGNVTTGGFAFFGQPIDYDFNRYDFTAEYDLNRLQVQAGFTYNDFTDNQNAAFLRNPFAFTSGYGGPASRVASFYGLPPNNSEYEAKLSAGYTITDTTRISSDFQYSLGLQNEAFIPGTGNANLAQIAQPQNSLKGMMRSFYTNVQLTSSPLPRTDFRLAYTLDNRNNNTNRNNYLDYVGDTATTESTFNLPLSYTSNSITGEAGYRLAPETKASLTVNFNNVHRSYAATEQVQEFSVKPKIRGALFDGLFGELSYTYSTRNANDYDQAKVWKALTGSPLSNDFQGLVQYFEATRRRNEAKAQLDYSPLHNLTATFSAKFRDDTYPRSILGLQSNYNISVGPDIQWDIMPGMSLHAYYMFERYYFHQNDIYWTTSTCNSSGTLPQPPGCNGLWNGKTTDNAQTVGVTLGWQPVDKLQLNLDYTFNVGNAGYSITDGGLFALGGVANASMLVAPGPNVHTMLNEVTLRSEYTILPTVSLVGSATLFNFSDNDFAFNQTATQFSNAIFPGNRKLTANVVFLWAGVRMRFGIEAPPPPPAPVEAPAPARTYLVFFDWDKADLTDRARQIIADAAQASAHTETTKIEVDGHADLSGTPQYNQKLSLKRAQTVGAELVKDGVPENIIMIQAFGDTRPLVPTARGVREPQNRRVEIVLK
jgi:MtrB/PioB family decaheme-associated outer membrane protein